MADSSALEATDRGVAPAARAWASSRRRGWLFICLQHDRDGTQVLARALQQAATQVRHCERCNTFTEAPICRVCSDTRRDAAKLCVIETPADQAALERTGAFRGYYFVLMGKLSPLDGIGPKDIGLARLFDRALDGNCQRSHPRHQFHRRGRGDRACDRRSAQDSAG